jgi:hypothetical protein
LASHEDAMISGKKAFFSLDLFSSQKCPFLQKCYFKTVQFRCTGNAPILCILESSHVAIKFYAVNILHELIAFSGSEQNFAAY